MSDADDSLTPADDPSEEESAESWAAAWVASRLASWRSEDSEEEPVEEPPGPDDTGSVAEASTTPPALTGPPPAEGAPRSGTGRTPDTGPAAETERAPGAGLTPDVSVVPETGRTGDSGRTGEFRIGGVESALEAASILGQDPVSPPVAPEPDPAPAAPASGDPAPGFAEGPPEVPDASQVGRRASSGRSRPAEESDEEEDGGRRGLGRLARLGRKGGRSRKGGRRRRKDANAFWGDVDDGFIGDTETVLAGDDDDVPEIKLPPSPRPATTSRTTRRVDDADSFWGDVGRTPKPTRQSPSQDARGRTPTSPPPPAPADPPPPAPAPMPAAPPASGPADAATGVADLDPLQNDLGRPDRPSLSDRAAEPTDAAELDPPQDDLGRTATGPSTSGLAAGSTVAADLDPLQDDIGRTTAGLSTSGFAAGSAGAGDLDPLQDDLGRAAAGSSASGPAPGSAGGEGLDTLRDDPGRTDRSSRSGHAAEPVGDLDPLQGDLGRAAAGSSASGLADGSAGGVDLDPLQGGLDRGGDDAAASGGAESTWSEGIEPTWDELGRAGTPGGGGDSESAGLDSVRGDIERAGSGSDALLGEGLGDSAGSDASYPGVGGSGEFPLVSDVFGVAGEVAESAQAEADDAGDGGADSLGGGWRGSGEFPLVSEFEAARPIDGGVDSDDTGDEAGGEYLLRIGAGPSRPVVPGPRAAEASGPRVGEASDGYGGGAASVGRRRGAGRAPGLALKILGHRYGVTGLVLLALAATYGAAQLSRPEQAAKAAQGIRKAIQSAVVACPSAAGARTTTVALPSEDRGGRVDVAPVGGGADVGGLNGPGAAWAGTQNGGPLVVRATGAPAAGLETEQSTVNKTGDDRGVAGLSCAEPGTDMWFLGPGPAAAKSIGLYLTNVDDQPASVDVEALSDNGPLDTTDGRGTSVEPHTAREIDIGQTPEGLGTIVNTAQVLALHVHATVGRVAASVRVRTDKGKGVDWVPMATAPATQVVVPGIPGGDGQRTLMIAVPGQADAKVKVQVITPAGAYAPGGQDTLAAPARTVTTLPLDGALSGKPAAVRLSADRPIFAGYALTKGTDVAFGTATAPLVAGGPAGPVAEDRYGAGSQGTADSTILLTAPAKDAVVRLTAITAQGVAANPQDVRVAAGRTLEVRPAAPAGAGEGFSVMVSPQPGSGPVYAARVLTVDKGITVLPIFPAAGQVIVPPVTDSMTSLVK